MNSIERYFLQNNKLLFTDIIHKSNNKKIVIKNINNKKKYDMYHSLEIKNEDLKSLYDEIANCCRCSELCSTRSNIVFGRGVENPDIVFIGEAPGADEDKTGLPFVGRGGKLFDKWLDKMNIKNYYIMNSLKCRPPQNRDPMQEEKDNCRDFFTRQLSILNPKIICALGRHGFGNVVDFDFKKPFSKARGVVHYYTYDNKNIPVIATYHPAYILRNSKEEVKVIEDLEFLLRELEKIV